MGGEIASPATSVGKGSNRDVGLPDADIMITNDVLLDVPLNDNYDAFDDYLDDHDTAPQLSSPHYDQATTVHEKNENMQQDPHRQRKDMKAKAQSTNQTNN